MQVGCEDQGQHETWPSVEGEAQHAQSLGKDRRPTDSRSLKKSLSSH